MLRQVSSRNQRTKGLRVKHVLQTSLLLAFSVWLLYQIMHSHDKESTLEERNSGNSLKLDESQANIFKFGRKDLPHTVEMASVTESRIKEEKNGKVGDVEQENKREEIEDGGQGGGNNDIDGQDQEKVEEADRGKEIADEEDKNEDENGQVEELDSLKDQEHEEVSHEAREKSFQGDDAASAVVHNTRAKEHEERSREAQEMRFKGDDASSSVAAHDAQVTEHEVGSYEEREKSFQDDDASSAVEQGIQMTEFKSENGDSGGVGDKQFLKMERKEIENETVTNRAIYGLKGNDSSAAGLDISNTHLSNAFREDSEITPNNYPTINGNAVEKRESDVGASPKLEDGSSSNSTTGKSNNHTEQQADLPRVNVIGNQTELHMNSMNNEMELQTTSSTMFSRKREPQMNSTSVSDQSKSEINMVINVVTNGVPLQNESATLDSVQGRNATVEMVTPSENKLENKVMEQTENSNTTARPEESGGSSTTSSATNENGETVSAESGNSSHNVAARDNGNAHTDQSTLQDIKTKAKSGGEQAAE